MLETSIKYDNLGSTQASLCLSHFWFWNREVVNSPSSDLTIFLRKKRKETCLGQITRGIFNKCQFVVLNVLLD